MPQTENKTEAVHIGTLIQALVEELSKKPGNKHTLFKTWYSVVGAAVGTHTKPIAFRDGILTVLVGNSVLLAELSIFLKPALIKQLNNKQTDNPVKNIQFKIGDVSP